MKHTLGETVELSLWLIIGSMLASVMVFEEAQRSRLGGFEASWLLVAAMVAAILAGAVIIVFLMRRWSTFSGWVKWSLGIFGFIIVSFVVGSSLREAFGLLFPSEWAVYEQLFAAVTLLWFGIAISLLMRRKHIRFALFGSNLAMVLILGSAAAAFAVKLTPVTVVALLAMIAIYDAIAVWKLGTMQEMALMFIEGGIIPGVAVLKEDGRVGIIGGGDIFAIGIVAGVFLTQTQFGIGALFGMIAGVIGLLFLSEDKFYPAIPFIFAGLVVGLAVNWVAVII